ncbi:hypothetical protein [Nostoc sp.]|uniref:hypothetical protein n=1 Tax=Nostoc sp. TaxID=1180 RepID=UPI002FFB0217
MRSDGVKERRRKASTQSRQLDRGVTKFEVLQNDFQVLQHDFQVPQHDFQVLQHDFQVPQHDF